MLIRTASAGPATAPGGIGPTAVPSTVFTRAGFDPCSAPDPSQMDAWLQSPYRGVGVYLGGSGTRIDSDWFDVGTANRPAVERLAGYDRDLTAVGASARTFDCAGCSTPGRDRAKSAVLSRDDTCADALGGPALAAQADGPLLLTAPKSLNQNALNELHKILGPGARVYPLGGPAALAPAIENALRTADFQPGRVAGADRFETAVDIARTNFALRDPFDRAHRHWNRLPRRCPSRLPRRLPRPRPAASSLRTAPSWCWPTAEPYRRRRLRTSQASTRR